MSDESTPKMTLQQAVASLSAHRMEWEKILDFLEDEREKFFGDQRQAESANDVMKLAGSISTLTEIRETFIPQGW